MYLLQARNLMKNLQCECVNHNLHIHVSSLHVLTVFLSNHLILCEKSDKN